MALWGAYTEVGFYCPRFRDIHGVGASNCGYSRACPVPYQFAPPHCVIRCCVVFMASQVLHRFVSVSLLAARRSLVGMRSWITIYRVDRWTSEIHAVCRLVHRRFQFTSGFLRTTRITSIFSVLPCMSLSVPYVRILCLLIICALWRYICHIQPILAYMYECTGDFAYMGDFYCFGYVPFS